MLIFNKCYMKKIICSAIKLKDWTIITWLRHWDCYKTVFLFKQKLIPWTEEQWFINSKGWFQTREEALLIILWNKQEIRWDREFLKTQTILFSEDLY